MSFYVVIRKCWDGGYEARMPAFPGFSAYGNTIQEVVTDVPVSAAYFFECASIAPSAFDFTISAPEGGMVINGTWISAEAVKEFTELGSVRNPHFSRGDVDADIVNSGNRFVSLVIERGIHDFRTFATLAKHFVYSDADDSRRRVIQNFLAARWVQYLLDNPGSSIENLVPTQMRAIFDEIDKE